MRSMLRPAMRACAIVALLRLSACTFVYIAGDANRIADSGNHSGTLNVPEPKVEQRQ
jgi:hypothetical protein